MNMSRSQQRMLLIGSIIAAVALCGAILLPVLGRSSNCGGNSAALSACKSISICFQLIASERGEKAVSIAELSAAEREYFQQVSGLGRLCQSRVLVTPAAVGFGGTTGGVVIAACDTPFNNVPRRIFGKAPLTHAVAYADGTVGLLSVEEFRRLDFTGFIDVRSIQRTNVEPDGAPDRNQPIRAETNRTSARSGSRR